MPIAITPDQVALQASIRDWAKQAGPLAAVRRLGPGGPAEPAAWTTCQSEVAGLGVFSIAVPGEAGGAGGALTDLAAALEQLAIALVPGPVLPTALAGLLLAAAGATAPLPALLGPDGAADSEASYEFLLTRCLSIAGGTTQILLNQVAERVLGLSR